MTRVDLPPGVDGLTKLAAMPADVALVNRYQELESGQDPATAPIKHEVNLSAMAALAPSAVDKYTTPSVTEKGVTRPASVEEKAIFDSMFGGRDTLNNQESLAITLALIEELGAEIISLKARVKALGG